MKLSLAVGILLATTTRHHDDDNDQQQQLSNGLFLLSGVDATAASVDEDERRRRRTASSSSSSIGFGERILLQQGSRIITNDDLDNDGDNDAESSSSSSNTGNRNARRSNKASFFWENRQRYQRRRQQQRRRRWNDDQEEDDEEVTGNNLYNKHRQRVLKNVAIANTDTTSMTLDGDDDKATALLTPCDPTKSTTTTETADADTGILQQCPSGQYCIESQDGNHGHPGGYYCSDTTTGTVEEEEERQLQMQTSPPEDEEELSELFIETLYYFCLADAYYNDICTCTINYSQQLVDVDCSVENECLTEPNKCGVDVTDCASFSFQLNVTSTTEYSQQFTYNFTQPYAQVVSYIGYLDQDLDEYDNFERCKVEFNGQTCRACYVDILLEEECVYTYETTDPVTSQVTPNNITDIQCYNVTVPCYAFDCSNTDMATILADRSGGGADATGTTCNDDAQIIYGYLDTIGCVDKCNICGMNNNYTVAVTNPDGQVNLTGYTYLYSCGDLDFLGRNGYLTENECSLLYDYTTEDCGCVEVDETDSPTAMPVTPRPTRAPTTPKPTQAPVLTLPTAPVFPTVEPTDPPATTSGGTGRGEWNTILPPSPLTMNPASIGLAISVAVLLGFTW